MAASVVGVVLTLHLSRIRNRANPKAFHLLCCCYLLIPMKTRTSWIHHILIMTRVISIMTLLARSRGTTAISRQFKSSLSFLNIRGGASSEPESNSMAFNDNERKFATVSSSKETQFVTLAAPAPGSRMCLSDFVYTYIFDFYFGFRSKLNTHIVCVAFHLALPVHDLNIAKDFYGRVLGCIEGRSSSKVQYAFSAFRSLCSFYRESLMISIGYFDSLFFGYDTRLHVY